jgi:single-stranded DNA-binding protein
MIDVAFFGFLAADAELRTSQASGKPWTRLRVGVGKDDAIQWLSVAVFGKAAEMAGQLKKGHRVYCEDSIRLETWKGNDGIDRHNLSVACFKLEQTHRIGRNRIKNGEQRKFRTITRSVASGADADLNDDIPF